MLVLAALAWSARRSLLAGAAALLVDEDALAPAAVIVASHSMGQAAALEAAWLYQQQISARIVMTSWARDPMEQNIRQLGIPYLDATEWNNYILEQSHVPPSAITILPDRADGTGSEVAAIAAFAERCQLTSILVITARTHTARTKWLLRRKLPDSVHVFVRSPRFDQFAVDGWWRERDQSREMLTEYLRWANTVLLRDFWGRSPSTPLPQAVANCPAPTPRGAVAGL
jgi:uncharacterized SAM-binding protein YcdF (DUF218 family)